MQVEFIFDTACPWCYLGRHRLLKVLAARPAGSYAIRWTSFLLNPDMPPEGAFRRMFMERKLGGTSRVLRLYHALHTACEAEGLPLDLDRQPRIPNTADSHRLVKFADLYGLADQAVEALSQSYFVQGRDIGQLEVLQSVAQQLGLSQDELRDYLQSEQSTIAINADTARAHRLGVSGVPCVIFDDCFAITGAQESKVLARLLDLALVYGEQKIPV